MAIKFLWDSCVCIDWIEDKDPAKRALLRPIIDAATAGNVLIVASALVLAEVVQAGKDKPISDEDDARIRLFFLHPYIELRPIDPRIAHLARDIMRDRIALKQKDDQKYKKIKVNDAIHIATALECGCDCLHSFDKKDMLKENLVHQIIGHPKLRIELPSYTPPPPPVNTTGQQTLFEQYGSLDKDIVEAALKSATAEPAKPAGEPPKSA